MDDRFLDAYKGVSTSCLPLCLHFIIKAYQNLRL